MKSAKKISLFDKKIIVEDVDFKDFAVIQVVYLEMLNLVNGD